MLFIALLAAALFAPAASENPPEVQHFIAWYKTYTGSFMPPEVIKAYSAKLRQEGIAQPEADRRMEVVRRAMANSSPELLSLHFDRIYAAPEPPFNPTASDFMIRVLEGRKPGRVLDVAMGQGRNSLYLARQGWDVTGYDISDGGMAQARAAAEAAGLKLRTIRATHAEFDYGHEQWDAIIQTFAFTNLSDSAYRKRVIDSLRPGGILIIEGFGDPSGREPKNTMIESFRDLRIVQYEDRVEKADWGLQKARMQRLAAVKD